MLRDVASKVMWVGRATVFVVGLAVIGALVLGAASAAFGANGDVFRVGQSNFASAVSVLDKSGAGPALRLLVDSGAPMAVNSSTKVANLNADKVDGRDAPLSAVINTDGSTARGVGVTSSEAVGGSPGAYLVTFNRNVSSCAYVASLGDGAGNTFAGEVSASNGATANEVFVGTSNSSGTPTFKPFHLAVLC
jgi:hypothetical protein